MDRVCGSKWLGGLVLCVALLCGCTLSGTTRLPEAQRASLGRLGMATAHFSPQIVMDVSQGRGHSAARGAGQGALNALAGGIQSGDGFGFLISILLTPVFAAGGAVYGSVAGDSADQVRDQLDPLTAVFNGTELQQILKDELLLQVRRCSQAITRSDLQGAEAADLQQDYRGEVDLDTVLEVGIHTIRLQDRGVSNARVDLQVTGFARLVQVSDGSVVKEQDYPYQSMQRDLEDWGRHGGAALRSELSAAFARIAGRIVDDYLLPVAALPPSSTALSAVKPLPQFCFYCQAMLKPLPASQPVLCWRPFPAADDLDGPQKEWLRGVESVVYDLSVGGMSGSSPLFRYDIDGTCYRLDEPVTDCQPHFWQVRARFRVKGVVYATPWIRDGRNRFRTSCVDW